ncbi:glycosyltransferase, partial [Candidatus Uhrbacteria bacterium]|nr:glycosyltransferase [Candidatus Uhrbacteria bacterium]
MSPTLSIVILNYRTPGLTKYCVRGIDRSGLRVPYEVLVVDNASRDHSLSYLRDAFAGQSHVQLIPSGTNAGYAAGNNRGIRAARGEYVLILNPDILVLEGAIDQLLEAYTQHPQAAVVGPQLLNPDRSVQYSCYRFPRLSVPVYRRTVLGHLPFARSTLDWYVMKDMDHR